VLVAERFRLERELGSGGMGTVWAATHVLTQRRVALKFLLEKKARDPGANQRLLREARAACAIVHPALVAVDDVLTFADGSHALVMDLLEGESLRARLQRDGTLDPQELRAWFTPVLEALELAHTAGIVHRDLKPDNLFLVATEPRLRILDFGVAKMATEDTLALTSTGAMLGTPYYMAPEQAFGEPDIGPAADIWALGVVLFECLTGRRPTQAANLGQVLKMLNEERLPKLIAEAGVPLHLAECVDCMLVRDPAQRPDAADVRAMMLREVAPRNEPVPTRGDETRVPAVDGAASEASAPPTSRAWWGALGLVGAVVLVGWLGVTASRKNAMDAVAPPTSGAFSVTAPASASLTIAVSAAASSAPLASAPPLASNPPNATAAVASRHLAPRATASATTTSRAPAPTGTTAPSRAPGIVDQPPF
jgi:serine/threonine-protein kinase